MKRLKVLIMLLSVLTFVNGCQSNHEREYTKEKNADNTTVDSASIKDIRDFNTTTEVVTTEEATTERIFDESVFLEQVRKDASWNMQPRDRIDELTLTDKKIYMKLSLVTADKEIERFSDISDAIIAIEEGYDMWDSITIEFYEGAITKTKKDLVNGSLKLINQI